MPRTLDFKEGRMRPSPSPPPLPPPLMRASDGPTIREARAEEAEAPYMYVYVVLTTRASTFPLRDGAHDALSPGTVRLRSPLEAALTTPSQLRLRAKRAIEPLSSQHLLPALPNLQRVYIYKDCSLLLQQLRQHRSSAHLRQQSTPEDQDNWMRLRRNHLRLRGARTTANEGYVTAPYERK
jgi:hypothetical protein